MWLLLVINIIEQDYYIHLGAINQNSDKGQGQGRHSSQAFMFLLYLSGGNLEISVKIVK